MPELAYLAGIEVTGRAQESSREVEGGVEAELAEHGRGGDKVGLATIVIGDTNARLGRIEKSFAEILTPSRLPPVLHRSLKLLRGQSVQHVVFGEPCPPRLRHPVAQLPHVRSVVRIGVDDNFHAMLFR